MHKRRLVPTDCMYAALANLMQAQHIDNISFLCCMQVDNTAHA